jgi:membrane associated rhomboid family serine protease
MIPLRDTIPSQSPPVAVWLLIGVNVACFVLELEMGPAELTQTLEGFGLVPASFGVDRLWQLVTCSFLHGSLMHLVANMWTLWIFGDNVEDRMGPLRFVGFYLLCAVLAALAELMLQPNSPAPMIGASGAIAGVMGAYLVMYPRARIILLVPLLFWPLFFTVPALVFLGYWFVIQVLSGGLGLAANTAEPGGIAFGAHVGGFIAGVALHPLFVRRTPRRRQSDERSLESAWQPRGLS